MSGRGTRGNRGQTSPSERLNGANSPRRKSWNAYPLHRVLPPVVGSPSAGPTGCGSSGRVSTHPVKFVFGRTWPCCDSMNAPPLKSTSGQASILGQLPQELESRLLRVPAIQLARLLEVPRLHKSPSELYRDSCVLKRAGFNESDIRLILRNRFARYYRAITDREIDRAIENADGAKGSFRGPKWPQPNPGLIESALRSTECSVRDLEKQSPVADPGNLTSGQVIDRLFSSADLLCLGDSQLHAKTEARGWFAGTEHYYPYIVPNPMAARVGTTTGGHTSVRSLSNSGPWRTQVIEFDFGSLDEQVRLLHKIRSLGVSFKMVVYSGGKSLHGWFDVAGWREEDLERLRRFAAALGADRATFVGCQFVRTPNARRQNGELQKVLFIK